MLSRHKRAWFWIDQIRRPGDRVSDEVMHVLSKTQNLWRAITARLVAGSVVRKGCHRALRQMICSILHVMQNLSRAWQHEVVKSGAWHQVFFRLVQ